MDLSKIAGLSVQRWRFTGATPEPLLIEPFPYLLVHYSTGTSCGSLLLCVSVTIYPGSSSVYGFSCLIPVESKLA